MKIIALPALFGFTISTFNGRLLETAALRDERTDEMTAADTSWYDALFVAAFPAGIIILWIVVIFFLIVVFVKDDE